MIVLQWAALGGMAGVALGLVLGVIYAFGGLLIDLFTIGINPGTWMAFGALFGMPALFGAGGAVLGAVVGGLIRITRRGGRRD